MKGMDVVEKIERVGSADGKPFQTVKIVDCGEVSESKVHGATEKERGNVCIYKCSCKNFLWLINTVCSSSNNASDM